MDIVDKPHLLCNVNKKPGEVCLGRDLHRTLPGTPHPWGGMGLGHRGSAEAAHAEEEEGDGAPLMHFRGSSGGKSCAMLMREKPFIGRTHPSEAVPVTAAPGCQEQGAEKPQRAQTHPGPLAFISSTPF